MKKRIFAILTLALVLTLSAFTAFAAPLVRDDIEENQVYTISGELFFGGDTSVTLASSVTLEEGLYIIDVDFDYYDGELNDASFYLKDINNTTITRTIYTFTFWSDVNETTYVYIASPFNIVFGSTSGTTCFDYTINIYSTKSYNDYYQEGYNNAFDSAYETGYEVGYGDAEAEINSDMEGAFKSGYNAGKSIGYNEGKEAGYILGEADGWQNAIEDADEVKTAIGGIFTGVFDGTVDAFNELTEGITIMGLTLKQILLTIAALGIIGICIWLFALKK